MVTFCNRALTLKTANFSEAATIQLLETTTYANAFNWLSMPLNTTNSISCNNGCTITLWGSLTGSVTSASNDLAMAVVTNRTLIVEPVNIANTVQF